MSSNQKVEIGGRAIGQAEPVFIVAEAGVNHDGELETALELIDAAAEAGADAVKFQTFDPDQLVSAGSGLASYQRRGVQHGNGQKEMLSRLRFGEDAHAAIVEHSRKRGIVFLSTPFDHGSAALLARLGVPAFKVGSGELTNLPFLAKLTRYSLPILLS
ncbi:MAG: N-acetylneuraminate synthase family protein, partial [Solirubrobacteraceae bacterium]